MGFPFPNRKVHFYKIGGGMTGVTLPQPKLFMMGVGALYPLL